MTKKHQVVIASLLKPVDDTRMYEKMALSMAETNKYALNIIGFYTKNIPKHPNITFFPLFNFKRLSRQRLLAPLRYWQYLLKVKPELIIVNSHDLLLVSLLHRIIFGSKLIYDVRENYKQNIIWSSDLPYPLRQLLARVVRGKEWLAKRMIIHFIVAEKCYLNECSFISAFHTVLENKARKPAFKPAKRSYQKASTDPIKLIYSGTIAHNYGVFDCLKLVEKLRKQYPALQLLIIGHCPRTDTLRQLQENILHKPYISLIGGPEPVPHPKILQALQEADYALISYQLNPSNQDCFPTRIWECLAHQVPMLMRIEHPWKPLLQRFGAGLALDFQADEVLQPDQPLNRQTFYERELIPSSFYWEWEAKKLLELLERLF